MLQPKVLALLAATLLASACTSVAPLPKQPEVQVSSESYVVKLTRDAKSLPLGERQELDRYLDNLGDLQDVEFSIRRTHRGMQLTSLLPVEHVLITRGADPKKIHRLAEIGVDYEGAWVDVEIIAKRYVALVQDCPDYSHLEMLGNQNVNSSNFGCATASAFAMSVADPRDIARGRDIDPASGVHSAAAIERYNTDAVKALSEDTTQEVAQ